MTAVEWLHIEFQKRFPKETNEMYNNNQFDYEDMIIKAKEMENKQLFLASNTSAKEAYEAGQESMYCGCYEVSGCSTYEEWLYEIYKSE